jgi:signal transduction histidine kinase/ActR/RegA family two-component response regulator
MIGAGDEEEVRFDWRRGGAAVAGLFAALILLSMIFLVKFSNDARERALAAERHTFEVSLVVRNLSANVARSEAALARFVLDEDVKGSGNIYASDWQLAGYQIDQLANLMRTEPEQLRRVAELRQLYRKRGDELSLAARAALQQQGDAGISYFYQAATKGSGQALDNKLEEIIRAERQSLRERTQASEFWSEQASRRADYLSVIGMIVGLGAIFLGVVAVQALRQNAAARRQIENEAERAEALEQAVRERTQELWEANQALKEEAREREAAEAQLRQVQKMEAVGQLTGGIAHDFNNMLAVVVGGIDLALRRLNGPRREVMMHLNNAMEGATRAAALTRRLLSFARSEPLLPERVDSNDLISGMSDLLDRTLGEQVRVEVDLEFGTWPAYVDPHQLENAILNLAVNARDAMEGRGLMRISTENVKLAANQVGDIQAGDYVKISVTDTGCGMAPDVLEREAHVPGARILLVEDDPRVRSATVDALEDLDYEPVACESGAEAIRLFQAQEFDLVITDVIMPEMTGPELIRYLKLNSPRDFAVLFVTGYVGEGESDDLRGHELLRKPFTVGALASAVSAALARASTAPPRPSAAGAKG